MTRNIDGLPTDAVFVTEEILTDEEKEVYTADPVSVTGVISSTTSTASIRNTRKTSDLIISKVVENGISGDASKKFAVTVSLGSFNDESVFIKDESISGTYGDVTFRKGTGTFNITDGTSKTIAGLPKGIAYTVEEAPTTGFIPVLLKSGIIHDDTDGETGEPIEITGSNEEIVNVRAVCKITDSDGKLLYFKDENNVVWPAVYRSVDDAFDMLQDPDFYTDLNAESPYGDTDEYNLEMLVRNAPMSKSGVVPAERTLTVTTASTSSKDGYPYSGTAGTAGTITKTFESGSMIETFGELTLGKVTLDGGKNNGITSESNGGIVLQKSGTVDVTNGATLRNSAVVNANGGAIYIESGRIHINGSILNNSAVSGGAVYLREGIIDLTGGTINRNQSSGEGAGIFVTGGTKLYLSGDPNFGGSGVDGSGNIIYTSGNFSSAALEEGSMNGGKSYAYPRQDIYLAGGSSDALESLVVNGRISSGDGTIWVYVQNQHHYEMLKQFAILEASMSDSQLESTYRSFRNAQTDLRTICGGEPYLTGNSGDVTNYIYWTGGFDVTFRKIDPFGNNLPGAEFTVYTDIDCTTEYHKSGQTVKAYSAYGDGRESESYIDSHGDLKYLSRGEVLIEKLPTGIYYMKETAAPTTDPSGESAQYINRNTYVILVGEINLEIPDGRSGIWADLLSELTQEQINAQRGEIISGKYEKTSAVFQINQNQETFIRKASAVPNISKYGILNRLPNVKVILRKTDADTESPLALPGAMFDILAYDRNVIADNKTSINNGIVWVGKLSPGIYYLHETVVPSGYTGGWFKVTVYKDGEYNLEIIPGEPE